MARSFQTLACELYQVVGVLAADAGVFEHPQVQRTLDDLARAMDGKPLPKRSLLPFAPVPTKATHPTSRPR